MAFSIGEAADRSGCTPPTIRYYESIGLLPRPQRTEAGRRSYGTQDIARFSFIRQLRDFGLGIAEVRDLLAAAEAPNDACARARPIVEAQVRALRAKRAELKVLETALNVILSRCDMGCRGEALEACAIFDGFRLPIGPAA